MITKIQVEEFLKTLKEKIKIFDIAFRPRDKNSTSLAEVDILPVDRIKYLMDLTADNYYSGPNKDTYDSGRPDYYEFGIHIKRIEVYIKISLGMFNKRVDCMSFHIAEHPIVYPLKTFSYES
jgi:hypothetical protein